MKPKRIAFGILLNVAIGAVLFGTGIFFSVAQTVYDDKLLPETSFNRTVLDEKPLNQVKKMISESEMQKIDKLAVTVRYKGKAYVFKASDSGVGTNVQRVLSECFDEYEQTGNAFEKLQALYSIRTRAASAEVNLVLDEAVLREKVSAFAESVKVLPVNATAVYDPAKRTFKYTEEKSGSGLDGNALYENIKDAFLQMKSKTLPVEENIVPASITKKDLENATRRIGNYKTALNSNNDRNTNIKLMCKAFNGVILNPGEVFSTNKLVGERTAEKGFKEAPAIASGYKLTEELGGGICQSTGTLYNAVLLSGLEIVERSRHSWPSNYLPIGQDAMVDWPRKDFSFRNNTNWPVYIAARVEGKNVIMEVFGAPPADGSEIRIETEILKVTKPEHKRYIKDSGLRKGKKVVEVTERIGYSTRTKRNYYMGEILVRSELVSEDHYPAVRGIVRIGTGGSNK